MAYLGRQPLVGNYQVLDAIVATTTDTYALTKDTVAVFPQTPSNCIVSLNGVIQAPVGSYTISGSNIVFDSALTGSDSIDFITVLGDVLSIGTPTDGTVTTAKLADSSVTLAKLTATGTKDTTTFLRGDNTFAVAGETNTPAFHAYLSANQSVSDATDTKCAFDTEVLDTDNCYDNSTNYKFTPTVAGKYFVYSQIACNATAANNFLLGTTTIKKNGSSIIYSQFDQRTTANGFSNTVQAAGIVDMNGSTDYLESFGYIDDSDTGSSPVLSGNGTAQYSNFGAYRIIE